MNVKTDKGNSTANKLILLFACTYMVSYLTRINYGTIISAMVNQTGFAKDSLSMALTGSFITYGVGQIISGILGDRFSPKKLVACGFIVTIVMNILLPFCVNPWLMCALWCVNGFAQSFMWPPLVRLMSSMLSVEAYQKASVRVSWGSSVGTILLYLCSPLILSILSWQWVFWICAACGICMLLVWLKAAPNGEVKQTVKPQNMQSKNLKGIFSPLMIAIMVAIALQGMLRDGVTTWMPSYISETYHLDSGVSILSGVLLPLFSILSFQVSSRMYGGRLKSPVSCSAIIFAMGTVAAFGLFLINGTSAAVSVLLSALLTGCMHGVNLMLICMIPPFFKREGNVSTVSGVLNSCTYVGSAVSTYGIALLSEWIGWRYTVLLWCAIAAAGGIICLICMPVWNKKYGVND